MKKLNLKYKGEINDTYNANAYALKCMYVLVGALVFCWVLDILNIFIVDLNIMNIAAGGAVAICAITAIYAFVIGIDKPSSRYIVMFLLVAMITLICTELAYHTTMLMIFPLVCSAQYFDRKISFFTAISTCVGCAIAVMIGYRIGLCDSNMLLLTYTTSAKHLEELTGGSFTINSDKSLMFLFFVFPKWLIISAMMPLLNHVAKDIQIRTSREAMARHMAEIDALTGVYNRTKYLQGISTHYPTVDKVGVLFFDINNLKEINDNKGHEYGDILIHGLADELKARDDDKCKSFRIGGDEFVMIIEDTDDVSAYVDELEAILQDKHLEEDIVLSVAIGSAVGKGKNIENVVKQADEKMYQRKQEMKH